MIDIIIVACYLVFVSFVSYKSAKNVKSEEDYISGGKSYNSLVIFATLSASYIGGGFTLGLAEKTFSYGIVFALAMMGFSLKEILIAKYVAPRMNAFSDCYTVGDIMQKSYGVKAKIISGIASFFVCGGIIGAQIFACGNILYMFLGVDQKISSIIVSLLVVLYVTKGGIKSAITADLIHFSVLIIMVPLIMIFGLYHIGGVTEFVNHLPSSHQSLMGNVNLSSFIILFLSFLLGETLIPPYVQKLLIGKSSQETKKGTMYSGIMSIFFFLTIGIIGMEAKILNPILEPYLAMPYVINQVMPIILKGLAVSAMLAIIMSSTDSFLNATSISIKRDLLLPIGILKPNNPDEDLYYSKIVTLTLGLIAIIFALFCKSAIDILLYSYQFWTPFILFPLLAVIFGVKADSKCFIISSIAGIIALIIWNIKPLYETGIDGAIEGVIFGVIVNVVSFMAVKFWNIRKRPLGV